MSRADSVFHVERQVLLTAMSRASSLPDMPLMARHFASEQHAALWETIQALEADSKPTDPVSVADVLEQSGRRSLAVLAMEIAASRDIAPSSNAAYPAGILLTAWRDRESVRIGQELASDASRREEGCVDRAIAALMALHAQDESHEHTAASAMRAAWQQVVAAKERGGRLVGVPTGLTSLDNSLGGFHDGDLIVVGARPAMGKTGLLLGMTEAAARTGEAGLITGEQPHEQVGLRWMAAGSGVSLGRLRAGKLFDDDDWRSAARAVSDFSALPIRMLDRSSPDIAEVIRVARRWKHQHGIRALYVDYLQRIEMAALARSPKHERVGAVARALKNLARDLRIPVVVLAQVNREAEGERPQMKHLADSSEIEKEADQIMMLWRDLSDPKAETSPAEINVVKNRHGNIGTVHCLWHGASTSFVDRASSRDEEMAA